MSATLSQIQLDQKNIKNVISTPKTVAPAYTPPSNIIPRTASTLAPVDVTVPKDYVLLTPTLAPPSMVDVEDEKTTTFKKYLKDVSLIAKSDAEPQLISIASRLILEALAIVEEAAEMSNKYTYASSREDVKKLDELHAKRMQEIRNFALAASKDSTWSYLATTLQYFLSVTTIVLGTTLMSTGQGATAGAFLIAAGGLGLVNQVAKDTGAYQAIAAYFTKSKEMQEKIATWISTTLLFASLSLGMAGGVMSSLSAGLGAAEASMSGVRAAKKLEFIVGTAAAGIAVGKANSERNMAKIQKNLLNFETHLFLIRRELQRGPSAAKSTLDMLQLCSKEAKKACSDLNN